MNQYIQSGNCEATELDGEWIILNSTQFTITKLNEVGGHCWSMLKEAQTVDTLTQTLLEKFSIRENLEQIKMDMEEFVENLVQYGLINYAD
ncbi:PqqD family protein [Neobacillus drentensis]|uniref:PqqD family protein n=1 Tax=Neobacillus drentensis TaxID=220684 RepID=UPI0030025D5A